MSAPIKTSLALTPAALPGVPCLFAGAVEHGIRRAAELGYDAVELHLRDAATDEARRLVGQAHDAGLALSSLGTGQAAVVDGLCLSTPDPAARAAAMARVRGHLDLAAGTGAVVIIGSLQGRFAADPALRARQQAALDESLRALAVDAAARGVTLALEALNRYETNVFNTAAAACAYLARLGAPPTLGLLLDTFHMNIEEAAPSAAIRAAGRRLKLVHWADSHRGAAGTGHTDFAPLLAALRESGYTGYLSAEIQPRGDDETAARASLHAMRALLKPEH